MKGQIKEFIQISLNRIGLQVRRVERDVSYVDPYTEQVRLLKNKQVKTVFEVGAFDGRDTLRYAELFPDARVFGFEPFPASFQQLSEKTQHEQRISTVNVALSNVVGTAEFNIAEWPDASSLLRPNLTGSIFDDYMESKTKIEVQTETIDHYCQQHGIDNIDLLKMDAQGAEYSILEGAEEMIQQGKIGLIYAEVNFMELYQGAKPYDVIAGYLRERGFMLHNLYGLISNHKGQLAWGDAIFIQKK